MLQKNCFVVTAIGQNGTPERSHADKVLQYLIEPVCKDLDYNVIRVDQETTNGSINESIINHLKNDDLVIADMTGYNANAFYELGYRQALNLPLVPIIEHTEKLPFDVVTNRTVFYDTDVSAIENSKTQLKNMILEFKDFVMPSQRKVAKTDFDIINEKLDTLLKRTKSNSIATPSLSTQQLLKANSNTFDISTNKINNHSVLQNQVHPHTLLDTKE